MGSTQVCSLIMIDFSMTFQKTFTSFMIYQILFNILVTIYYIIFYSKENFMNIFQKKLLLLYSVSLHFTTLEIIECLKGKTTTIHFHVEHIYVSYLYTWERVMLFYFYYYYIIKCTVKSLFHHYGCIFHKFSDL